MQRTTLRAASGAERETTHATMKCEDTSWHYGGDLPAALPPEAGGTQIGMFVAWCLLSGLAGEIHATEFPKELEALREKLVTPGAFFLSACDEKFTDEDEDLGDEGNRSALAYYQGDCNPYIVDYERLFGREHPCIYDVPDTWESYAQLRPTLDDRLQTWHADKLGPERPAGSVEARRPWWRLW